MRRLRVCLFASALGTTVLAGPVPAAPDQTLGMALLSARVTPTGSLIRGAGAVSSERDSTGEYFVIFNRDIRDCIGVGSTSTLAGSVTVRPFSGPPDAAEVLVRDADGQLADISFDVIVFCEQ